tara:strand:+ start:545 stop:1708 length:1164 start_codon:yes stop_codon:yes gene_type:complete
MNIYSDHENLLPSISTEYPEFDKNNISNFFFGDNKNIFYYIKINDFDNISKCIYNNKISNKDLLTTDVNKNTILHLFILLLSINSNFLKNIIDFILFYDISSIINKQNTDLNTPLHLATMFGDLKLINCLIDNGAKTNIINKNNECVLSENSIQKKNNMSSSLRNNMSSSLRNNMIISPLTPSNSDTNITNNSFNIFSDRSNSITNIKEHDMRSLIDTPNLLSISSIKDLSDNLQNIFNKNTITGGVKTDSKILSEKNQNSISHTIIETDTDIDSDYNIKNLIKNQIDSIHERVINKIMHFSNNDKKNAIKYKKILENSIDLPQLKDLDKAIELEKITTKDNIQKIINENKTTKQKSKQLKIESKINTYEMKPYGIYSHDDYINTSE